jgi:hypothetical protein
MYVHRYSEPYSSIPLKNLPNCQQKKYCNCPSLCSQDVQIKNPTQGTQSVAYNAKAGYAFVLDRHCERVKAINFQHYCVHNGHHELNKLVAYKYKVKS